MRRIKILLYLIVNLFLAAEIIGLVRFYINEKQFFYTRATRTSAEEVKQADSGTLIRLHPFFGFILKPGISLRTYLAPERIKRLYELNREPPWLDLTTNNYGIFSPHDYPYITNAENTFVVGIFGGSLAHWFSVQGAQKFSELLKAQPQLENKNIVVLNFAAGGYKQPQQLLMLNYFLSLGQKFDLVLNIDGFNEIALSDKNLQAGIAPIMPSSQHLAPLSALLKKSAFDKNYIDTLAALLQHRDFSAAFKERSLQSTFAGEYLLFDVLSVFYKKQSEADRLRADSILNAASEDSMLWLMPQTPQEDFAPSMQQIAQQWQAASRMMGNILASRGVSYIHVLQPNQYVSHKVFSAEEESLARGPGSPYRVNSIQEGYKVLRAKGAELKMEGINFFDGTSVLDNETAVTFSDNCCHLNQNGNEILAAALAQIIFAKN